ncbi:MAG TPA: tripartite tricarboxylate transporter substrate binding protein [Usitatibacter sp.]|nr:tripartite tricarboxylate transporter substrate binding protein [Usitatibacter sp.]
MSSLARIAFACAAAAAPFLAHAQDYPNKSVKIIVAFTAGGTTDIMARSLAQRLTERYKQPFVIENRPGAGGNIGTEAAVRAAPDGYTLIVNSVGPMAVNPTLYKSLPYNPLTDLVPIAQISDVPNVLVVHPSLKVKTVQELVAYAKANPGKMNYASTGIGTSSHLAGYMLASRGGFEAAHVPYKGAEALRDLLTGRVQFMFATIPSVIAHIKAGNLVAVAVSSSARSRSLPDVPTVADSGFPGFEAGSWFGVFAPKGTPPAIVAELNRATNEFIAERQVQARMIEEGADPAGGTPEQFGAFVRKEFEKWRTVVRESGAVVE